MIQMYHKRYHNTMPKLKSKQESTIFRPSKLQLDYLKAYIEAPVTYTRSQICQSADVSRTVVWKWEQIPEYVDWFHGQIEKVMDKLLVNVYSKLYYRALKSFPDCRLFLQRFDKDYSEKQAIEHSGLVETIATVKLKPLKKNGNNNKK